MTHEQCTALAAQIRDYAMTLGADVSFISIGIRDGKDYRVACSVGINTETVPKEKVRVIHDATEREMVQMFTTAEKAYK